MTVRCAVDQCERAAHARGWCTTHYNRWRKHGTTELPAGPSLLARIMMRVVKQDDGCWIWTGARMSPSLPYGQIRSRRELGGTKLVHRVVYELLRGTVPDGLELDHLCRTPPCCNPDHLEPVTHAENMRRGIGLSKLIAGRKGLTHCRRGHPFTSGNTYVNPGTGNRKCKQCFRSWSQAYYLKRKATAA